MKKTVIRSKDFNKLIHPAKTKTDRFFVFFDWVLIMLIILLIAAMSLRLVADATGTRHSEPRHLTPEQIDYIDQVLASPFYQTMVAEGADAFDPSSIPSGFERVDWRPPLVIIPYSTWVGK